MLDFQTDTTQEHPKLHAMAEASAEFLFRARRIASSQAATISCSDSSFGGIMKQDTAAAISF
jgi:hypothetical protein